LDGRAVAGAPPAVWGALVLGLATLGASPILIRLAGDVPALALAAWRTLFVTALLVPAAAVQARAEVARLGWRDLALVGTAGVFLGLHFMAWIGSVQLTSVASASVLVTLSPVFIAVLGAVFLRERPSRRTTVAIIAAVTGAALIGLGEGGSGGPYPNPGLGNAAALGAALLVSVYLLIGRAVRQRASFLAYFAPLNAAAAATCVVGCLVAGVPLALPLPALGLALAMGLGPGLLGHGSFNLALRYLPAAFLGLLSLVEPVVASAVALVWFGEVPGPLAVAGIVVVLAAIGAVVTGRRTGAKAPAS
jgi:drug/metabolite transporter (DMT)-like permease